MAEQTNKSSQTRIQTGVTEVTLAVEGNRNDTDDSDKHLTYTARWLDDIRMTSVTIADDLSERLSIINNSHRVLLEYIIKTGYEEQRGVAYEDLQSFDLMGHSYTFSNGTVRNQISALNTITILNETLLLDIGFIAGRKYWSVKFPPPGLRRGNLMTSNPTGVRLAHNWLYKLLKRMPMEDHAIHDIHLKFTCPKIWALVTSKSELPMDPDNKSIKLEEFIRDEYGAEVGCVINRTDTLVVYISCSLVPFNTNIDGLMLLITLLARVQQKLLGYVNELSDSNNQVAVPSCLSWLVTLLHLGRDGKYRYTGQRFEINFGEAAFGLYHIYTKDFGETLKVRTEVLETPMKETSILIHDLLDPNHAQA